MIRCFIAVDIPEPVLDRLRTAQEALRRVAPRLKYPDPSGIHLTIKFLGPVEEGRIRHVCDCLQSAAACGEFEIGVSGLGAFPSERAPRVVWAGISPGEPAVRLNGLVEESLAWMGIRESRPFHPHLTLARAKESSGLGAVGDHIRINAHSFEAGTVTVRSYHLYQSLLGAAGARYVKLATFVL